MDILFLDLGRRMGWARGVAGKTPVSGAHVLRKAGDPNGLALGELARWLVAHKRERGMPDLIGIEKWLPLAASKDTHSVEDALRMNGVCHAIAGVWGVNIIEPYPATIRAAVCGKAHDKHGLGTKRLVIDNMIMRKLVPIDESDDNLCDALCGWLYLEATVARVPPAQFVLTGR